MEPIDGVLLAGIALLVAGVYLTLGLGAALVVAGVSLVAVWLLLHLFGADE